MRPLFLAAILCPALAAQQTWTVGTVAGSQFAEIQPAINAAAPGDVIRVRSNADMLGFVTYASFTLNKAVTISAFGGAVFVGPFTVTGVPAGRRARVEGLGAQSLFGPRLLDVVITDCPGDVEIVDALAARLTIQNAGRVCIHQSSFVSPRGTHTIRNTSPDRSVVIVEDSTVALQPLASFVGSALPTVETSGNVELFVANAVVRCHEFTSPLGSSLGDAIIGTAKVNALGGATIGGSLAGAPVGRGFGLAYSGAARVAANATVIGPLPGNLTLLSAQPTLRIPAPVAVGSVMTFDASGGPLLTSAVLLGAQSTYETLLLTEIPLLVLPDTGTPSFVLDAAGKFTFVVPVPNLPSLRYTTWTAALATLDPAAAAVKFSVPVPLVLN